MPKTRKKSISHDEFMARQLTDEESALNLLVLAVDEFMLDGDKNHFLDVVKTVAKYNKVAFKKFSSKFDKINRIIATSHLAY